MSPREEDEDEEKKTMLRKIFLLIGKCEANIDGLVYILKREAREERREERKTREPDGRDVNLIVVKSKHSVCAGSVTQDEMKIVYLFKFYCFDSIKSTLIIISKFELGIKNVPLTESI